MTRIKLIAAATVALWGVAAPAHAYIDAGTGSVVIQAVIAFFAGAAVFIATFWRRIIGFFRRSKSAPEQSATREKIES